MGIYMLQAMIPMDRAKTRFQAAIEIDYVTGQWFRPIAGRAAASHDDWALIDPTRVAGIATAGLLRTLPGLFHITSLANISQIIRSGLKPGCETIRRGRADIHFSPFPPLDHRNGMMARKLDQIRRSRESWAVISVDPKKCDVQSFCYCAGNGIVLCGQSIPTRAFDCIWGISHDGTKWSQQWIYETCLENVHVIGYRLSITANPDQISMLLCVNQVERERQ